MSIQATHEYLIMIWKQYQEASKKRKSELLNEVVKNTGLHRGSAKRLMGRSIEPEFKRGKGKSVNAYSDASKHFLKLLWKDVGYLGAVRMKAAIPMWINYWSNPDIDDYSFFELKKMSASTIERTLKKEKANLRRRLNMGTKGSKNNKMKTLIPIRDLGVMPTEPGHCEIDCVAHCGGSLTGTHIWTLTVTDIVTGHTENAALEYKNGWEVKLALDCIEDRLPFKIIALYMDNGSEFLNEDVHKRFSLTKDKIDRETIIQLFRSRPYKKNDQCYVEQKNYTHVRELFGYDRYSGDFMVQRMNNIYKNEWRLLTNYFHPQIRLKSKERHGSKIKRTFHPPATSFENLIKYLPEDKISEMEKEFNELNPFELRKKVKRRLSELQGYNGRTIERLGKHAA